MRKLLRGAMAVAIVGATGVLGNGLAAADTSYNVGGAKVPGVPWYEFTYRAGSGYYPDASRVLVDYPGGAIQGRLLANVLPGAGLDTPTVGESVVTGMQNLDAAIRSTTNPPARAVGLSEGALVLDAEQARLAHDPAAPPPDQLSFTVFGDPARSHAFGQSMVTTLFPPGTFIPVIDYTVPKPVESQYDTKVVVAAYDGVGDFPDRPSNLVSVLNAAMGAAFDHTPVAFTNPDIVPPQNIKTVTNSKGATTTTYLVPDRYLPLTLPLHYLGMSPEAIDQIDSVLRPMVDAGYSRNDHPQTAPTPVDPVGGMDPLDALDPATRADVNRVMAQVQALVPAGLR